MKPIKALLWCETLNTLKMAASFYGAMLGCMAIMLLVIQGLTGEAIFTTVPGIDLLAMVLAIVVGAVAMSENYRYFKQNGFTRRAIFLGDLFGFALGAAIVAGVGALLPVVARGFIPGYLSAVMQVYGSDVGVLAIWALLFFSFFFLANLAYFFGALALRLGKRRSAISAIVLFCLMMVVLPTLTQVSRSFALFSGRVIDAFIVCLGFSAEAAPLIWPAVATAAVASGIAVLLGYAVMRRFEWRW